MQEAKATKNEQYVSKPLMLKARAKEKLGHSDAALHDVQEALLVIEELRAHLVPSDFMKRGFAEKTQEAFAYSVELLQSMQQPERAITVAEQARSRAFLDLLATHQIALRRTEEQKFVAERKTGQGVRADGTALASPETVSNETSQLTTRGGKPTPEPNVTTVAEPELASGVSAESASLQEMQKQAQRLHSTVLSYWVADDTTFV